MLIDQVRWPQPHPPPAFRLSAINDPVRFTTSEHVTVAGYPRPVITLDKSFHSGFLPWARISPRHSHVLRSLRHHVDMPDASPGLGHTYQARISSDIRFR